MPRKEFGLVLRNYRERGRHSRRVLAEAVGLSEGAIRDYELGKRSPSPKTSVSPWVAGHCDISERVHSITLLTLVARS